jgi:hypothetical protein
MSQSDIRNDFPNLSAADYLITSPEDDGYNCFCWAIRSGKNDVWCSPTPIPGYYWPSGLARNAKLETFIELYRLEGNFEPCADGSLETGFEKVALYVDRSDKVSHAARQLDSGKWTSKLGVLDDIEHVNTSVLEADYAASVRQFLKRRRQ